MVNGFLTVQHHFDHGSDSDSFNDPSTWQKASYDHHPCDDLEPIDIEPNGYRQAALYHLELMYAVDRFLEAAPDTRFAIIVVAITLGWPSTRSLSIDNIAGQLGCTTATLTRSIARFKKLAGLGVPAGGVRPGAGDGKPAAVARSASAVSHLTGVSTF